MHPGAIAYGTAKTPFTPRKRPTNPAKYTHHGHMRIVWYRSSKGERARPIACTGGKLGSLRAIRGNVAQALRERAHGERRAALGLVVDEDEERLHPRRLARAREIVHVVAHLRLLTDELVERGALLLTVLVAQ